MRLTHLQMLRVQDRHGAGRAACLDFHRIPVPDHRPSETGANGLWTGSNAVLRALLTIAAAKAQVSWMQDSAKTARNHVDELVGAVARLVGGATLAGCIGIA